MIVYLPQVDKLSLVMKKLILENKKEKQRKIWLNISYLKSQIKCFNKFILIPLSNKSKSFNNGHFPLSLALFCFDTVFAQFSQWASTSSFFTKCNLSQIWKISKIQTNRPWKQQVVNHIFQQMQNKMDYSCF